MIVKIIKGKEERTFKINPISGSVEHAEDRKADRTIYLLPVEKTTFRIYKFPFKEKEKIKKAIEGDIKLNPLFKGKNPVSRSMIFTDKNGVGAVTFITLKEEIESIKNDYSADSVDSEAAALLRVLFRKKVENGTFYYKSDNGGFFLLSFKDGFIKKMNKTDSEEFLKNAQPLSIEDVSFSDIPFYGSALQFLEDTEINFLKEEQSSFEIPLIKGAIFLAVAVLLLSFSFFIRGKLFDKEIERIKKAEAELFKEKIKDIPPVDPFTQIKGLIEGGKPVTKTDAADILSKIGDVKPAGIELYKMAVSRGRLMLDGVAPDITELERFSKSLEDFNVKITETVRTSKGVRFKLEGVYKWNG